MKDVEKPAVAVCGLGTMGAGMAGRLLSAGYPTTVYNRTRKKVTALAAAGATVAASPKLAAMNADIVISMVADDEASRRIWLGGDGVLSGVKPGTLLIESSTLTVAWIKELAAAAQERDCAFVDAPVTGSKPQAAAGELLFLAGGPRSAVEKARPLLSAMGRGVVYAGDTGSGALLKLVNNFLCAVQTASMAEALAWIEKTGINVDQAVKVLGEGAPGSPIIRRTAARTAQNNFTPDFSLRLMIKDLTYAIREGSQSGVELRTAAAALQRFREAEQQGLGEDDFAAVTVPIRK
ncbi:MAG TPA: NAD(P)-dependent oxidoreductase [Terriglobales bacterium]|nr:NAD(P)-dependent oxidoreductase [Terriglobales bacterium]